VSAADEAREELEATIWRVLGFYTKIPRVHHVQEILAAAERYRHAAAGTEEVAARTRPVHLRRVSGGIACGSPCRIQQPAASSDPSVVTCRKCRTMAAYGSAVLSHELAAS
jgi:hypothetical protein